MPRTILGKVSLTPKGEYSPDTAYTALDVVSYGGNSWLALQSVTGVAPVEGENWMLLAQKGDQGASFTRLEKTAGTGAPGTIDTYTAYNSEGQAAGTVQVYNGMDGTGAGDFKADGTVPMTGDLQMAQHKVTGLADATEDGDAVNKGQMDAALEGVTVTTDAAPTEDSTNPVQSGGVFDALAGKADLTLSNLSNRQRALRNIGGRPNRNLLDNWYFVGGGSQQGGGQLPINQRGELVYHGPAYGIDRWAIQQGATLTVNADGITIQNTGSRAAQFSQTLELTKFYPGASYTASALVKSVTGNAYIFLQENGGDFSNVFSLTLHDGLNYGSGIFNEADFENNLRLIFVVEAGASVKLSSSKLELGPTQTLAYQDESGNWQLFETPDYAEELAKCQRYLLQLGSTGVSRVAVGYCTTASQIIVPIPIPTTMRINLPTVQYSALSDLTLYVNGTTIIIPTEVSVNLSSANTIDLIFTVSGATPGNAAILRILSNGFLRISAEL